MGKKKTKTPIKADLEAPQLQPPIEIPCLGSVTTTAVVGPQTEDLENSAILCSSDIFQAHGFQAGELVAIGLSDHQNEAADALPGLTGSAKRLQRKPQPKHIWLNLVDLRVVPPSSDAGEASADSTTCRLADSFGSLSISDASPKQDRGRERARKGAEPRSGVPEALQIHQIQQEETAVANETIQQSLEPAELGVGSKKQHSTDLDRPGVAASKGDSADLSNIGNYVILGKIWPAKLASTLIRLPPAIQTIFGGEHAIGSTMLIYKIPDPTPRPSKDIHLIWEEATEPSASHTSNEQSEDCILSPSQWLRRILAKDGGSTKELLLLSISWHLRGLHLLPGNPVPLPILGKTLYLRHKSQANSEQPWSHVCVDKTSKVHFLLPEEPKDKEEAFVRQAQEAAEKAGEAAAAAVGGGLEGPAASAAHQAALMGTSALQSAKPMEEVGGFQEQIELLEKMVILPLKAPELFQEYQLDPPKGVLLHGPPGTGKTRLAAAIARKAGVSLLVLNGPDVLSGYLGHSELGIQGVFAAARACKPAIIFIDEVDALAPAREESNDPHSVSETNTAAANASARVILTLAEEMSKAEQVSVIAATNLPESLDPALRRPGRLDVEIEIGIPRPKDREAILRVHMKALRHNLTEGQIMEIAKKAHGFVGADLAALCDEAAYCCLRRVLRDQTVDEDKIWVTEQDFATARLEVQPSALRDIAIEVPNVRWEDIGGMEHVKERLRESVEWPQKYASKLHEMGAQVPKGVLLYGPPGCSKTMLAKAVATEAGLNFFSVKGGELFSKYVGDSEKAVATLFRRAKTNAPSVIFFDEIDGLVGSRDDESSAGGVENRVIAMLLTAMDGLDERGDVVVIAATNRPDMLDSALLRPGRFDRLLYVPLPDLEARRQILHVRSKPCPLANDVDLNSLAEKTEGFSGADINNLVREAGMAALYEDLESAHIAARHFLQAFEIVRASVSVSAETKELYEGFRRSI